jgi:hypothetical protein
MTTLFDSAKTISRRQLIKFGSTSMAGLIAFPSLTACSATNISQDQLIIGGYSHTDKAGKRLKKYGVLALQAKSATQHDEDNYSVISDFSVPDEVHLAVMYPDNKSILVNSRKPSASLLKYSLNGELIAELKPLRNQHFEGHAIFSIDEKYLYVTASDFQQGSGKLLKLNSHDLSLVEMYDTGGIGPHELVWQAPNIIAIANTGVLTHPDSGRDILNLESIQSNVVLFNTVNKAFDHEWSVPLTGLSARHLDRMDNGDLVIGCQYKKEDKRPPCVAFASKGEALRFADSQNETLHWNMKGYTASIKSIPNSNQALISNPRGHLLTQWENKSLNSNNNGSSQILNKQKIQFNKGIKISKTGEQAWVSTGAGELLLLNTKSSSLKVGNRIKVKKGIWWANHLG